MDMELTHGVDWGQEGLDKQETEGWGVGGGRFSSRRFWVCGRGSRETGIRDQRHPGARWHWQSTRLQTGCL